MIAAFSALSDREVFVTGGTGFIGSAFVRAAVRASARVTVLSRKSADHWRLAEVAGRYSVVETSLDTLPELHLDSAPGAIMVHCAAAGVNQATNDIDGMVATNVAGTVCALQFALRQAVSRFVLLGSSGEYGPGVQLPESAPVQPTSEYGATRASATLIARAFGQRRGLDVVIVRPFAVYGPFEASYRLIPHVILGALRGETIRLSSGQQTRDYVHVQDVAAGIACASTCEAARGGLFNLCTGVETTVLDVAELALSRVGGEGRIEVGAIPTIPGEMWRTTGDPSHASQVLRWEPRTTLTDGLTQTVAWFRDGGHQYPAYRP